MFTSKTQAIKTVANLIVERDRSMLPVVNGLLNVFGYPTVEAPRPTPAPTPAPKADLRGTPVKTTDKEQRSGLFVVDSTNIDTVEYQPGRRLDSRRPHLKRTKSVLTVTFVNGSKYQYTGVSQRTFDNLIAADSKGSYFNEYIKDQYPTKRTK